MKKDKPAKKRHRTGKQTGNALTKQQEIFVNELVKGTTQRKAYLKAYPSKKGWKESSLDVCASQLANQPKIKLRKEQLLDSIRKKEEEKTVWNREQSIEALRFVIDTNKQDIENMHNAIEEELELLEGEIAECKDIKEAQRLLKQLINKKKQKRASMTSNAGIIQAVGELNRMQGFNEENLNVTAQGQLVFTGENELED